MLARLGAGAGMSGVSCLCLTYGRSCLLEEAIQSVMIEDCAMKRMTASDPRFNVVRR